MRRGVRSAALLVTLGDPNGVGPELVCGLLGTESRPKGLPPVLLLGPEQVLAEHCRRLGIPLFWTSVQDPFDLDLKPGGIYCHTPKRLQGIEFTPGEPAVEGGLAAGSSLDLACTLLARGGFLGLVTCPLHKELLQLAGYDFPGHTEFLAHRFGVSPSQVCMHLHGPRLKVSLVTTHPPLRKVAEEIDTDRVLHCLLLTWDHLQRLGLHDRPVAVCGLNPHAGEGGRIGREEIEIISPALEQAREKGVWGTGPWAADTVFYRAAVEGEFSAVLAMYHDQGLGPLKLLHFQQAVNVTLGLPVVRTSVDHGTAFELVGSGKAGWQSLQQALQLACRLTVRGA
ncbi:MAG: 4-hydroxythreonine-4-phosphate dehydrogenase PdxA [Desulfohalobiaceae bacterium]